MRIAMVAPPWLPVPPTAYGGTEHVLDGLCRALQGLGHDVLLCTTGDSTCPVERSWTHAVALGTANISPAAELRHVIGSYESALAWEADIVHDHTLTGPFYAARLPQLAVVTTNHGPFAGDLEHLYRGVAEQVPVIAISHHQASTAGDIPIHRVIHHGVDPDDFPVGDGDGGYALFLGRMSPDKGVHTAIQTARRADVPLRIAAKMRERAEHEYFDNCVKPLLGHDVEYVGEVGGRDKLRLLADAICLLNPIAWDEPFGMVMIEALACGTPVVATARGATPEIVEDGIAGYLADDDAVLSAALTKVADLDRGACRRTVEVRFSTARMARDHVKVYEELAGPDIRRVA